MMHGQEHHTALQITSSSWSMYSLPRTAELTVKAVSAEIRLSVESIHSIRTERLNCRKVCVQWVPHSVQPQQQVYQITHCIDHLQRYAREGNEFQARVVACDESWCHHFEPESKRQSLQWKDPASPPPKESKAIHTSAGKVTLTFFFLPRRPPFDRLSVARDNSECTALYANLDHPSSKQTAWQTHPWVHSAPRQCKSS